MPSAAIQVVAITFSGIRVLPEEPFFQWFTTPQITRTIDGFQSELYVPKASFSV